MTNQATTDLLAIVERPPPLGGMGFRMSTGMTQATWSPGDEQDGLASDRIVHSRTVRLFQPTALYRLGVRPGAGYHKCGSEDQWDWVVDFRLHVRTDDGWTVVLDERGLPRPSDAAGPEHWFELGGVVASAAVIELRRSGLDGPWTPWNLADDAFELIGAPPPSLPQRERRLELRGVDLSALPEGLAGAALAGEVRYRAAGYEVGFSLGRAGFSFLGLDDEGTGRTDRDLLLHRPGVDLQGLMLHAVGDAASVSPALRCDVEGSVRVTGNVVHYEIRIPAAGQRVELTWTMHPDRIELHAVRDGERALEAWESALWQIALDPGVAATSTLGTPLREGRTGRLALPVVLHAPAHGNLVVMSVHDGLTWRSDADRPNRWLLGELTLGETPTERGTSILEPGRHEATATWLPGAVGVAARPGAPASVARALARTSITGLSFRADTGTFSNNSISIHCPMSMDTWSALALACGDLGVGVDLRRLLRDSLERWLDGGPGYASGTMRDGDQLRPAEDEYLISGVGTLLGLAEYLDRGADAAWVAAYRPRLREKLDELAARDLDGDGLIESPYRRGVSGEYDWSTNWYDVVSFGWKDAWVNAALFQALTILARVLPRLGADDLAEGLQDWAERIAAVYTSTFYNPETGWLAGWRCAENRLHDYAFLSINAIAVTSGVLDDELGRSIMSRLAEEYRRTGPPPARWGLPSNLRPIPDSDLTEPMHGFPHGFYLNGALSHSQSRHTVAAFYRVGMTALADELLEALCSSLADGTAFGGSQTGVDWRYWDGTPCGYEGQLTEQFGIMAVAIDRFGTPHERPA